MEEAQSRAEKLRLLKERAQAKREREEQGGEGGDAAEDGPKLKFRNYKVRTVFRHGDEQRMEYARLSEKHAFSKLHGSCLLRVFCGNIRCSGAIFSGVSPVKFDLNTDSVLPHSQRQTI
jgi:hypothetical protein